MSQYARLVNNSCLIINMDLVIETQNYFELMGCLYEEQKGNDLTCRQRLILREAEERLRHIISDDLGI